MTQLHELTALEQAALVRSGQVSPVELVEYALARIDTINPRVQAFATVTADLALAQAKDAEARARQDTAGLPTLFGVPTGIKDVAETAGVRTTYGSAAFRDHVPTQDTYTVQRLRGAGIISLGQTNSSELALSGYSDNEFGSTRTPWDLDRSAGGSSGGAAAAVAAGMVPIAHGNDGGGSIRIPASVCGVFGLKTSRGRISDGPSGHDSFALRAQGPMARSVTDAAAMLDALAGPMVGDPYPAAPLPDGETFLDHARREPGTLLIARYADTPVPVDPTCVAAYEHASAVLAGLGHEIVDIVNPFTAEYAEPFGVAWAVRSLGWPVPADREHLLRRYAREFRAYGRSITTEKYMWAMGMLAQASLRTHQRLEPFDAVLMPSLALPPQEPSFFATAPTFAEEAMRHSQFSPYTALYNVTGHPAASLPTYWTTEALPIGVTLVGRPRGDAALLSLCAQFEAAAPWSHRWPSL